MGRRQGGRTKLCMRGGPVVIICRWCKEEIVLNKLHACTQLRLAIKIKNRAQYMVQSARNRGDVPRWVACEECGRSGYAHHDDYTKPLKLRWLCGSHHALWHKRNREADLYGGVLAKRERRD